MRQTPNSGTETLQPKRKKLPVLLLVYNRPHLTSKVLEAIAKYKPNKLYISGDGPNPRRARDQELCAEVRALKAVIDWDCEIREKYADSNVGCRVAVSNGITWFFENEAEGIVLEDDCVPNQSFFFFLEEIVERYRDDKDVWGATGANTFNIEVASDRSYDFIPYALIWGWATWADRWIRYDRNLATWSKEWRSLNGFQFRDWRERVVFSRVLSKIKRNKGWDSWAYPWAWTVLSNQGLWVMPRESMITNVGFGIDSTHTDWAGPESNWITYEIETLNHPKHIEYNGHLTEEVLRVHLSAPSTFSDWLRRELMSTLRTLYRQFRRFN